MPMKEKLAWLAYAIATLAGVLAGYIQGGFVGALTALSGTSAVAAAVLGVQARTTGGTSGTGRS